MAASSRSKLAYPRPWKLRIACATLMLKWLAGTTVILGLGFGLGLDDRRWLLVSLAAVAAFVVFATLSLILGSELPCNVCGQPLLVTKGCGKHVKARRFLGLSHQLGVACPALFIGRFHCMYCGEKIPLTQRRRGAGGPSTAGAAATTEAPIRPATRDDSSLPAPR